MRVKLSYGLPMFAVTSLVRHARRVHATCPPLRPASDAGAAVQTMLINIHGTAFFTSIGANVTYIAFFTASAFVQPRQLHHAATCTAGHPITRAVPVPVARSIDVITDPLMGWISDSTRTIFGRRRPYMAVGCVFYAIFFALLFSPPKEISTRAAAVLDASVSRRRPSQTSWPGLAFSTLHSTSALPCRTCRTCVPPRRRQSHPTPRTDALAFPLQGALGPELTDDSEERNSLYFWYNIFRAIGILVAATAPVAVPIYLQVRCPGIASPRVRARPRSHTHAPLRHRCPGLH